MTLLRIDSSANTDTSVTRALSDRIIAILGTADVITRDLAATPLPQITQDWTVARSTPSAERTQGQHDILMLSDALIDEIKSAQTLLIGLPIYNFSVPAALKAWIDLVARAGVTFRYSDTGPVGLLDNKRAILAVASGGTQVGSDIDYATGFMRHVLGFLGITDVTIIAADALAKDRDATLARAHAAIAALAPA